MKMADEKFCVRWTDFESNISVAFKELREEKDFFDVTLVCNEGQIQAHKVITLFSVYTSPLQILKKICLCAVIFSARPRPNTASLKCSDGQYER